MIDFQYTAPATLDEAVENLNSNNEVQILAGGTDIIVQLREGHRTADVVLDVKKIPELRQIETGSDGSLTIGAAVPCWQLYTDASSAAHCGALVDATRIIGGWQIQSRASVGGNLCNSSPAADSISPLIVSKATALIYGPAGTREIPVAEFCTGPGRNILERGELLTGIRIPKPPAESGSAYQRFIPRNEMDIAVAGAATWVKLDPAGETIEEARIALAAVAPTPVIAQEAGNWLAGQPATQETFERAGELAKQVANPIDDMRGTAEYRVHLASVLTRRTLEKACERARG